MPKQTDAGKSNGYEEIAPVFIAGRGRNISGVGATEVAEWSEVLEKGSAVLDLGCGTGIPISRVLIERGFDVYGVDASPSMVAAFREHFPLRPVQCAAAEESDFFGRTFDAVVSWGLFFLLDEDVQRMLIAKVAGVLRPGGRFLFTAPKERACWQDAMTDRRSVSLGYETYRMALEAAGMPLAGTWVGLGDNHYYDAVKT